MGLRKIAECPIARELGQGGMGAVLEALSPEGEMVALKTVVWPKLVDAQLRWEIIERFQREARAMRALTHPNLRQVPGCGLFERSLAPQHPVTCRAREELAALDREAR